MPTKYDVLIAGGGVVGCAAALALAKCTKLKIAVIESHPPRASTVHPSFDARVIALAYASMQHLRDWQFDIDKVPGAAIKHIHVSDRKHLGQTYLSADDVNVDMLGKVVRLEDLGLSLYSQLQQNKVDYFSPEAISSLERSQDKVIVQTDKRELQAKLLVIAEGADSKTRSLIGIENTREDYQQHAIITNVGIQLEHKQCAFERFTKYGPVAFLPMHSEDKQEHLMSVVWSCNSDDLEHIMAFPDDAFLRQLQSLFGSRLGRLMSASARVSYPLSLKQSPDFSSHRCICIGNAAQSLHPIAGQGFNLAVRDISDLVMVLKSATDAGSFEVTQRYRHARDKDKQAVILATDTLVRGFSNHFLPLVIGRNKALHALNFVAPLKKTFAHFAMGQR